MRKFLKRRRRRGHSRAAVVLSVLCALLFVMLAGDHLVPMIAEMKISALLDAMAVNGAVEFKIKSIDMSSAEVSCKFRTDAESIGVGSIGSLAIQFSMLDLLHGKIRSITAENCNVLVKDEEDKLSVPVIDIFRGNKQTAEKSAPGGVITDLNALIPVRIDTFTVSGNVAIVTREGERYDVALLPYRFQATTDADRGWNDIRYTFGVSNSLNTLQLEGEYTCPANVAHVRVKKLSYTTGALASGPMRDKIPKGLRATLDLTADLTFDVNQLRFREQSEIRGTAEVRYRNPANKIKADIVSDITVSVPRENCIAFEIDRLACEYDTHPVEIPYLRGTIDGDTHLLNAAFAVQIPDSDPMEFELSSALKDEKHRTKLALKNAPALHLTWNGMEFAYQPQALTAEAAYSDGAPELSVILDGNAPEWRKDGMRAVAGRFFATVSSADGKQFDIHSDLKDLSFTEAKSDIRFSAPEIDIAGTWRNGRFRGETTCEGASAETKKYDAAIRGISWHIPYSLTEDEAELQNLRGTLTCAELVYRGHKAASLDGVLTWPARKQLRFAADTRLFTFDSKITADASFEEGFEAHCAFEVPEQHVDLSEHIAEFLPQLKEAVCNGTVSANIAYGIAGGITEGSAEVSGREIHFAIPSKKLDIQGGSVRFKIPNIKDLRSAPGQVFAYRSLQYDRIRTDKFFAMYHMESPKVWQLENAVLDWCGGHIRIGGVTYESGKKQFLAQLSCDRLDLPTFLTQLNLAKVEGSGTLNGTIPVIITEDDILFRDAFLYSTPGENGTIHAEFEQGALADSGEMALAQEALKDFSYEWTRFKINSQRGENEGLKVTFEINGKPNNPLHFTYDSENGGFVPSEVPCVFQGITLDVNLNIASRGTPELVDYFKQILKKK